jgi:hypothetical protein
MNAKEAGKSDRAASGIQFVVSDLLTPGLTLRFRQSIMLLKPPHFPSAQMKECAGYRIVQNPKNDRSLIELAAGNFLD